MKINIKFSKDNASFVDGQDTTNTIMKQVKRKLKNGQTEGKIMDVNGNSIGYFKLTA